MNDYNLYDFTVKEADILQVLKDAIAAGITPLLYINGLYYNVQIDNIPAAENSDDLPF